MDYSIFYKKILPSSGDWSSVKPWDYFVSAYNLSERIKTVFDVAPADKKHWLIFQEYGFSKEEAPFTNSYLLEGTNEAECMFSYLNNFKEEFKKSRVCVDITGFIRPHLIFLLKWFHAAGIKKFDVIYSEPSQYSRKEKTTFSDEKVFEIRQILGFEGAHHPQSTNDILIIGSGYDDKLISQVSEKKNSAKKIQVFGLPALRPEMYQENVLRVELASDAVGRGAGAHIYNYFAPAYDPFVTANVISQIVQKENVLDPITNLYLCPLSTKPQVLGFALYFLFEKTNTASSIIFPFCKKYDKETSKGIGRIWKYTIEFP